MTGFEEKLEALRARFVQRAAVDADAIAERATAGDWAAVRDVSHGLAGRAGMFGFAALSDAAKDLEDAVDAGADADRLDALSGALVSDLRNLPAG